MPIQWATKPLNKYKPTKSTTIKLLYGNDRPEPERRNKEVYVMKCLDFYKIGVSANVDERHSGIQSSNPAVVEIIYRSGWDFPRHRMAHGLEVEYHRLLKDYHVRGEWFDLSEENVENVIEWIKEDFAKIEAGSYVLERPNKAGKIYARYELRDWWETQEVLKKAA